jgi:hypothetical protein
MTQIETNCLPFGGAFGEKKVILFEAKGAF